MPEDLQAAIERVKAGSCDEADIQVLRAAFQAGRLVIGEGLGAVGVGGDVTHSSVIPGSKNVTGDGNTTYHITDIEVIQCVTDPEIIQELLANRATENPTGKCLKIGDQKSNEQLSRSHVIGLELLPSVPIFVGRDSFLKHLIDTLQKKPSPQVIVLIGQGGIGKTSIIVKLLERLGISQTGIVPSCSYQRVVIIDVKLVSDFKKAANTLLVGLGIEVPEPKDLDYRITLIMKKLATEPYLLLFDNMETVLHSAKHPAAGRSQVSEWGKLLNSLANNSHCSQIIITSRETVLDLADSRAPDGRFNLKRVEELKVDGIIDEDSIELLRQYDLKDSHADLEWVAERVKGHVLVLELLAAAAQDKPGYLRQHPELVTQNAEPILTEQLNRLNDEARKLLNRICALLIPRRKEELSLTEIIFSEPSLPSKRKTEIERNITQLVRSSLLRKRFDQRSSDFLYDVHPVIADFLRERKEDLPTVESYYRELSESGKQAVQFVKCFYTKNEEIQQLKLENSRTGAEWIEEYKEFLAKSASNATLRYFSYLQNPELVNSLDDFEFSIKQFLEQVGFCLYWGTYEILDSHGIPVILGCEEYEMAFQAVKEAIPKPFTSEIIQEIEACLDHLIERLRFY